MTLEDIVAMRPVEQPLYTCYSNYDPKGRLTAEMCYFGLLPPNQETGVLRGAVIPADASCAPALLAEVIASLAGEEPWEWLEDSVTTVTREAPAMAQIMMAPTEEAAPLLLKRFETAEGSLRLALAQLLLWHGREEGAETVLAELRRIFAERKGLPRRAASTNYGQLLPDHGLMPEAVYLVNSLSRPLAYAAEKLSTS